LKKLDVGQTISILANVGVIAGILFLGIELQQNNELVAAAANASKDQRAENLIEQIYSVPGLAEISIKAASGESLTESERLMLRGFHTRTIFGWVPVFRDYQAGRLESLAPPEVWKRIFNGELYGSSMHETWEETKSLYPPNFVQYMEENVVN